LNHQNDDSHPFPVRDKNTMPTHSQPVPVSDAVRARKALKAVRHFEELPDEILAALTQRMTPHHFDAGHVIHLEGEPAENLYVLEKGWAKSIRTAIDGREQATIVLKAGELFGDEAVFLGVPYPVTVIALEKVEIWVIQKQALLELVQHYPSLAMVFIRRSSERTLYYIDLVEDLGLRNVQARVANTLLKHAEMVDGNFVVPRQHWTTLDEMATRLGTVRDVLSRTLNALEAEGILKIGRTKITIFDPKKLLELGRV
jgi:CRP/FNR family transcriptional regulator